MRRQGIIFLCGLAAGILLAAGGWFAFRLMQSRKAAMILEQGDMGCMVLRGPGWLDISFRQEGKPETVVFHTNDSETYLIVEDVAFFDLDRDGIADVKADMRGSVLKRYVNMDSSWLECKSVDRLKGKAVTCEGKNLTFKGRWRGEATAGEHEPASGQVSRRSRFRGDCGPSRR